MKLITRDTDYAIRSLCFIGQDRQRKACVKELTKKLNMPRPFLRKILQVLNKEGILESHKGASGGFILKRDPAKIYLVEIMRIFQGAFCLNECFLNKLPCPSARGCVLRKKVSAIEQYVFGQLRTITIDSLLKAKV